MEDSPSGLAALTLWEALTLLLVERGLIQPDDVLMAVEDGIAMHDEAAQADSSAHHTAAAKLLQKIVRSTNIHSAAKSERAQASPSKKRSKSGARHR